MSAIPSPNMSMPVPVVGDEAGPQYAIDINACLSILDSHTHAPGSGVQITPSAININSDLPINTHNLTGLRSSRYTAQSSPLALAADLDCVYVSGVDLYYNDGNGNNVRITQSGGVAGSPGSIANLTSPASASYVAISNTFIFQSDANVAAVLDFRSAILRNSSASSFGLTLQPPTLGADTTQTLPPTPAATGFMTMTSGGVMSAATPIAQGITTSMIADSAITTAKIADANVTLAKMAAASVGTSQIVDGAVSPAKLSTLNVQQSASSGTFSSTGTTSIVAVTNLSVTITASGLRPILIQMAATTGGGTIQLDSITNPGVVHVYLYKNGSIISDAKIGSNLIGSQVQFPPNMSWQDFPSAGSTIYAIKVATPSATTTISMTELNLTAVEV